MRNGVASLKDLIDNCTDGALSYGWPADANRVLGNRIYQRMVLIQGWGSLSRSEVVGILSTVRNRILSFALEIEASNPDAGEAAVGSTPVPKEMVSQIFNNYVFGNVGNVAAGHGIQQTATVNVQRMDFRSLAEFLRNHHVNDDDIEALKHAVESDPAPSTGQPFGKKVSAWLSTMVRKSAEGTLKIATNVAANLLSTAIKTYYGT